MGIYRSKSKNTENLNGPYGPYEHILQDGSPNLWPKEWVFDENSKIRFSKKWKVNSGTQKWTFEAVSETEMTLKYILDHSRVIPTQFPYEKIYFLWSSMKIDKNRQHLYKNACLGSPAGVILEPLFYGRLAQLWLTDHSSSASVQDNLLTSKVLPELGQEWLIRCPLLGPFL